MNAVPSYPARRPSRLRFGPFVLDRGRRGLFCGEEPRHVQPRVYDLLELLLSRPGQVVTKQELLDQVWGGRPLTDSALTQAVAELRRALGEGEEGAGTIVTVHRVGYRFEGTVEALPEPVTTGQVLPLPLPNGAQAGEGGASAPATVEPVLPPTAPRPARRRYGMVSILFLALLLGLGWWWQASRTPVFSSPQRVGLLPLRLEPPDAGDAAVLDSAIWERLRRLGGIEVVRLALDVSTEPDPAVLSALAQQLRLQAVLQPRLQRRSDGAEVALDIVAGASTSAPLRRVLREGADASAVAEAIEAALATHYRLPLPPRRDVRRADPASEQLRLEGEALLMRRKRAQAIESFEQALTRDPNNAAAQAGLAVALAASAGIGLAQDEALARARRYANGALALEPQSAAAHAALGLIAMREGGAGAEAALVEFDRALALDPGYSDAWMWRSLLDHPALSLLSRIHDLERAVALDPGHHVARGNLAMSYRDAGRFDAAQALLAPTLDESEAVRHALAAARANVQVSIGRPEAALDLLLQLYPDHSDRRTHPFRLGALIALDEVELARRTLDGLARHRRDDALATLRLLPSFAELGDGERMRELIAALPPNTTERVLATTSSLREWRGVAAAHARDWPTAIVDLAPSLEAPGSLVSRMGDIEIVVNLGAWMVHALRELGDANRAEGLRERLTDFILAQRRGGYGDSAALLYAEARLAAVAGERERALERLQRAFEVGARRAENLRRDPRWDGVRNEPQFADLVRRSTEAAAAARARLATLPGAAILERWRSEPPVTTP